MTYGLIEDGLRVLLSPETADGTTCPATDLYRFAAGEATPQQAETFAAHLEACGDCRESLAIFQSLAAPTAERRRRFARRDRPSRAPWVRAWLSPQWLAPTFAALLVLFGVGLWQANGIVDRDATTLHFKGSPEAGAQGYRLHVAVARGEERRTAVSGEVVLPGDTLGFFYSAPAPTYLVLLTADEEGTVSQAYPSGEQTLLAAGENERLPAGAMVEEGGRCEWLLAAFAAAPLEVASLRRAFEQAARAAGPDCALPPIAAAGASVEIFVLRREAP